MASRYCFDKLDVCDNVDTTCDVTMSRERLQIDGRRLVRSLVQCSGRSMLVQTPFNAPLNLVQRWFNTLGQGHYIVQIIEESTFFHIRVCLRSC